MTRELKFRFWNGNTKEMHEQDETWDKFPLCGENECFVQFTGLKDKNGKDVYEGDIVHIRDRTTGKDSCQEVWTVEYDNSRASFSVFNQLNSIRYFTDDLEGLFRDCPIVEVTEDLVWHPEILGNIYSNPELLSN